MWSVARGGKGIFVFLLFGLGGRRGGAADGVFKDGGKICGGVAGVIGAGEVMIGDGFDIGGDLAVEHMNDAGGVGGEIGIMSNHNYGVAFGVEGAEFFHDDVGRAAVKVTGGLVGEDDGWVGDEGSGNGDALLLAARELGRQIIFALFEAEGGKNFGGAF